MGTELTYRFRVPIIGFLTLGSEAELGPAIADRRLLCVARVCRVAPVVNRPDRSVAAVLPGRVEVCPSAGRCIWADGWTIPRIHQLQLTPRVALIYQPESQRGEAALWAFIPESEPL